MDFRDAGLNGLIRALSYHQNKSKTKDLVIIDEAGKFSQMNLLYSHERRDNTKETTGVVLVGQPYFQNNLDRWRRKGKEGVPELWQRIQSWIELKAPSTAEK